MSFQKKVLICLACSCLLGVAYYFYTESILKTSKIKIIVDIEVYSKDNLREKELDLYINETKELKKIEGVKVQKSKNKFEYIFNINTKNIVFKLIRLDFEKFKVSDKIIINRIELIDFFGKSIITLKKDDIIKNLYNYSGSIVVNDNNLYFSEALNPVFDPYILLNVKTLLFHNIALVIILLLPWLIFIEPLYYWIYEKFKNKDFETLIVSIFLIVLPLKIAWLTFITLLLLLTSLIRFFFFSKRILSINRIQIIFFFLFLLYVIFGQVKEINDVSLQLAFILIPLIFIVNKNLINLQAFYEIYVKIFTVLMAIILVNGLIFIVLLNEYYNISAQAYFFPENTKLLNQKMMWWLPYSHPTFLSSFFLVGLLFCRSLYLEKLINKNLLILYFILSLGAIVLLGSRVMLFMLLVFVISFFLNKEKKGVIFLLIISVIFVFGLTVFIEFIDSNRFRLWNISYKAISENIFGYGIGSSKEVLSNPNFYLDEGYTLPPIENHSHNQFITIFLELGIIASVIFSFIIGYLGYVLYKKSDKVFVSIYFLFFVLLFTESLFKTATPIYYYTFIFCVPSICYKNIPN